MDTEREYSITLKFPSYNALMDHLAEYGELLIQKTAPPQWECPNYWLPQPLPTATPTDEAQPAAAAPQKNPDDRRGKHTKYYHELAREMKTNNPDMPYRECYKIVSKKPVVVKKSPPSTP